MFWTFILNFVEDILAFFDLATVLGTFFLTLGYYLATIFTMVTMVPIEFTTHVLVFRPKIFPLTLLMMNLEEFISLNSPEILVRSSPMVAVRVSWLNSSPIYQVKSGRLERTSTSSALSAVMTWSKVLM